MSRGGVRQGGEKVAWRATESMLRAVVFAAVMLILAVVAARPDAAALAAPIVLATAVSLRRRPSRGPAVTLRIDAAQVAEGERITGRIEVANSDAVGYDLVIARLGADSWLAFDGGESPYGASARAAGTTTIELTGTALRWGRRRVGTVHVHVLTADGLLISPTIASGFVDVHVYPVPPPFAANVALPSATGMVGFHRSRRPGDGGEIASVRPFTPGDRLRRIDWRVSLRSRELHVTSTLSDRDAEVVVVLDVMYEAGRSGGVGGPPSALDTTVRAAAGIADFYLHRGDRVALLEYGYGGRHLRAATGHRHYLTALEWLLDVRSARGAAEPAPTFADAHQISPRALMLVLTPLLDTRSTTMLARFARGGRHVVAVDTMPNDLLAAIDARFAPGYPLAWIDADGYARPAARLWRYHRANTIGQLRDHGVPVVPWAGVGSLDDVLGQVARLAAAPQIRR